MFAQDQFFHLFSIYTPMRIYISNPNLSPELIIIYIFSCLLNSTWKHLTVISNLRYPKLCSWISFPIWLLQQPASAQWQLSPSSSSGQKPWDHTGFHFLSHSVHWILQQILLPLLPKYTQDLPTSHHLHLHYSSPIQHHLSTVLLWQHPASTFSLCVCVC